jgi:hypothetical protein
MREGKCDGCRQPTTAPERWYLGDWDHPSTDRTGTARFRLCGSCESNLVLSGHPRVPRGQLRAVRKTYTQLAILGTP